MATVLIDLYTYVENKPLVVSFNFLCMWQLAPGSLWHSS